MQILVLFALAPLAARGGEPLTVPLAFEKKLDADSHGFLPLYVYARDGVILHEGSEHEIVPPPLEADSAVAYGYVYFTGQAEGAFAREVSFLVEHYDTPEPRFYVDLNNNLDFTDDEPAAEREGETQHLITLRAALDPARTFTVRLGFFRDSPQIREHPELLEQYATLLAGALQREGGVATEPGHWFRDQRLNVRSASFRVGEAAFQIGAFDADCNGSYADEGDDMVLTGKHGAEYLARSKAGGGIVLGEEKLILIGAEVYEVLEVDPAGAFVRIAPSDEPYARLRVGALLPEIDVAMLDGDVVPLPALVDPERFLLLDFWGHWCAPCVQALPKLKQAASELEKQLTIVGLHSGDHDAARQLVADLELEWLQAEASDALHEAFLIDHWPTYVLVDGAGRILAMDIQLHEALPIVRGEARK